MQTSLETSDHQPSAQHMRPQLILTSRLTKIKADKQTYNARDEAKKSNEIKFSDLVPNRASLMGIKIKKNKKNDCRNTASGPGEGGQRSR